jgi:3-hydroxyacyl-[acyl-carrier-protein] dehydratase
VLWDKEKIKSVLPHREPFLFLDEVLEIEGTERVAAAKYIDGAEAHFEGHFPGNPIMPGVLVIEAMAQASVILFSLDRPHVAAAGPDYYLGKVKAEFIAPVFPGDRLQVDAVKVKFLDNAAITETTASVNGKTVAKASLVFSIRKR